MCRSILDAQGRVKKLRAVKWTEGGEDRAEVNLRCVQPLNCCGFLVVCLATFYFFLRMIVLLLLLFHAYTGTWKGRAHQGSCDSLHALVLYVFSLPLQFLRALQVQLQKHTRKRLERAGM
jgi:hypothetical protein